MFLLSPAKLLVVLVVALMVLGPDKLPAVARQLGGFWRAFRAVREKLESEVRDTFPDLPSTETITQAVRSPLSFLDSLTDDLDESTPVSARGGPVGAETADEAPTSAGPALIVRSSAEQANAEQASVDHAARN